MCWVTFNCFREFRQCLFFVTVEIPVVAESIKGGDVMGVDLEGFLIIIVGLLQLSLTYLLEIGKSNSFGYHLGFLLRKDLTMFRDIWMRRLSWLGSVLLGSE